MLEKELAKASYKPATIHIGGDTDPYQPDEKQLRVTRQVIEVLCGATFQVYMIGFMPGFPYMGGLPAALEMPRLSSPRKAVPARSLAIAGAMCAVYPWESPGGWRLLGRTPLPFFSAQERAAPALLAAGDRVRWQAITRAEFDVLEAASAAGTLARERFLCAEDDGGKEATDVRSA